MSDPAIPSPVRTEIPRARRASGLRAANRTRATGRFLWEWAEVVLVAFVLFVLVRTFGIEAFKIPTGSMERTLLVGDFLLVNKLAYGPEIPFTHWRLPALAHPRRGQVIVFEFPRDRRKTFIKRLVGVPGDTVAMRAGQLWVNGRPLREPYVVRGRPSADAAGDDFEWQASYLVQRAEAHESYHPSRNSWGPLVVPEGRYFVLGDNRDNSYDSRYWGFVPASLVKGRPVLIYYSYRRDETTRAPWLTAVRWGRLGMRVR